MNIDKRLAEVLKYLNKHGEVFVKRTPFSHTEFEKLKEEGLVNDKNVSVPQGEGEHPYTGTVYFITKSGEEVLKHYINKTWATRIGSALTILTAIICAVIAIIELC